MKFKDFTHCIITDEYNRPMVWSPPDEQLCYVDDEYWIDEVLPLKIVTIKSARKQIKKSSENRKLWGYSATKYKLIPVKF